MTIKEIFASYRWMERSIGVWTILSCIIVFASPFIVSDWRAGPLTALASIAGNRDGFCSGWCVALRTFWRALHTDPEN